MCRMGTKAFVAVLAAWTSIGTLHSEPSRRGSAWDQMVRDNPAIVDDTSVGWQDRLILSVLSRDQAEAYYQGTRAEDILLDDGQTLAEYLEARLNQPGNVYVPLPVGCELFSVEGLTTEETQAVKVRGQCGIPEEATAVILQISAESAGMRSRVKVWASDLPEPAEDVIAASRQSVGGSRTVTTVVTLCADRGCSDRDLELRSPETATIRAEALGYFRPVNATDGVGVGGGILYYTKGDYNSFFGTGAGESNGVCDPLSTLASCYNTFVGTNAGASNTTGSFNAFFGDNAGSINEDGWANAFFGAGAGVSNTVGYINSFFGAFAGQANTSGWANAFFGYESGYSNTTGASNAFFGERAGYSNTVGHSNSFFGNEAGYSNIEGNYNAFFGPSAGYASTTGYQNAFFGAYAGYANTGGDANAFFGDNAGFSNTEGSGGAFFGGHAGYSNTTGGFNSFFGLAAGVSNTVESNNTFVGVFANLAPGPDPATSPVTNATAIGANAYVSQSNSLVLGSINGVNTATASTQVGIGVTAPQRLLHIAGSNAVFRMDRSTNSAAFMIVRTDGSGNILKNFVVGVDASGANNGQFIINDLGQAVGGGGSRRMTINNAGDVSFTGSVTTPDLIETSSLRFKTNVRTLEDPLDLVRQLRGVRFNWKDSGKESVGLIAEEVAQVLPELVAVEETGEASGVNYSKLVAVLVEAVKVQEAENMRQRATITGQQGTIKGLQEEVSLMKAQMAEIQARLARE